VKNFLGRKHGLKAFEEWMNEEFASEKIAK